MSYHGTLKRLTESAQAKVLAAYAAWQAGELSRDGFVQLSTGLISQSSVRATSLAVLALAAELSVLLGEAQPVAGVQSTDDPENTRKGLETLADDASEADVSGRLSRLTSVVVGAAALGAWTDATRTYEFIVGWERRPDPGACEICVKWAESREVFPTDVDMNKHKGCLCTPKPVVEAADAAE